MTTMVAAVYDALGEAGASEEKARRAVEALTGHDERFVRIEQRITALEARVASLASELVSLRWVVSTMGGLILALQIAMLAKLFVHG